MADVPEIDVGEWTGFERHTIRGPAGSLSVRLAGDRGAPAVLLNHSILTSSAIWRRQAGQLVTAGFRVVAMDMRGHGKSEAPLAPYSMPDLVADDIAVMDGLGIARFHQVGVSQGGMIGFGLGVTHPDRLESLCIVAARADAPPAFAAAWDDRIALVSSERSVDSLSGPTAERWFGAAFLNERPALAAAMSACIRETSAQGFVGCAQAIQGLNFIGGIDRMSVPTTLVIGQRDTLLVQPMRDLAPRILGCAFVEIAEGSHLPQIDQPARFDAVLRKHFKLD